MMLEDQVKWNRRKSYLLMLFVPVILIALIYVAGSVFVPRMSPFLLLSAGIAVSIVYVIVSYYRSDQMVLSVVGAHEADEQRHKELYDMVEGLALSSGLPMPSLYIQDSPDINAFATGKDPDDGKICVTTGALKHLDDQEMEGVLAHELAHIQNRDILFKTMVVALIGVISILSELFLHGLWFGGDSDARNPYLLAAGVALAILAPISARLAQLAVSRKREYLADASGAQMTRYPDGLADALEKIGQQNQGMDINRAVSSLYFTNPFSTTTARRLFSTHPPIAERVQRLREM